MKENIPENTRSRENLLDLRCPNRSDFIESNLTHFGQKLKGSFYRGSFRKGVAVPIVPGGGDWGRVRGGGGVWVFLWKMREKGKGVGRVRGWGGDRPRNRQVNAQALSKLPFSDLPFSFSPTISNLKPKHREGQKVPQSLKSKEIKK